MPATKTEKENGCVIDTDDWTIEWIANTEEIDLKSKKGRKHTRFRGDPHIDTDEAPDMTFPTPTCSFVLSDGTFMVAEAPGANQTLDHLHIFTTDHQHFSLGQSQTFNGAVGTVFLQQTDGSFYSTMSV